MLQCLALFTGILTNMVRSIRIWLNIDSIVSFHFRLKTVYLRRLKLMKFDAIQMQIDLFKKIPMNHGNKSLRNIIKTFEIKFYRRKSPTDEMCCREFSNGF